MTPCPKCADQGYVHVSRSRDGLDYDDVAVCSWCDGGETGIRTTEDAREAYERERMNHE